jgi:hypothetical protein
MPRVAKGCIEQLPGGSSRARVYAGIDPITKWEIRLKATAKTERQAHIELPIAASHGQAYATQGQALRIRDLSKAGPLLGEPDALDVGGDRDILVAVEQNLGA